MSDSSDIPRPSEGALTLDEAAALYKVTPRKFRSMARYGRVPEGFKLSDRCRRWSKEELLAHIHANCPPRAEWARTWAMIRKRRV